MDEADRTVISALSAAFLVNSDNFVRTSSFLSAILSHGLLDLYYFASGFVDSRSNSTACFSGGYGANKDAAFGGNLDRIV
ncbi:hypothetical protein K380107A5_25800 [Holdemania massiliensis]